MMLTIRELHFASLHQTKPPKEMKLIEQAIINAQESPVAAPLHQALMKTEIQSVKSIEIFGFRRDVPRFDQGPQFGDLFGGKSARCSSGRKFFQCGVDIMDFDCLVQIDLAHESSAILFDLDQPKAFQGAKGFPAGTPA